MNHLEGRRIGIFATILGAISIIFSIVVFVGLLGRRDSSIRLVGWVCVAFGVNLFVSGLRAVLRGRSQP